MSGVTSLINNQSRKPTVTVPTVTIFHNASIPSTRGFLCGIKDFANDADMLGTVLDNNSDAQFWEWSTGKSLLKRSGLGPKNIVLDHRTITTEPEVRVRPGPNGLATLVASLSAGQSHIVTADGDKIPVFNVPAAAITGFPQLRGPDSAGESIFTANFGNNFAVPGGGNRGEFTILSQNGKVISVKLGTTNPLLFIDTTTFQLCGSIGGSDITVSTATLLESIGQVKQSRFQIYVNEDNDPQDYFEHDFIFLPFDIYVPFGFGNFFMKVKYNPNAATDGVAGRWSPDNARMEANLPGASNLTLSASIDLRKFQEINGST